MQANANLWTELRGRTRVADVLVQAFHEAGADCVFAMPAESLNPILDAVRKSGRIRLITVRHEGAGALMASAYAKLTGRLGVCMGTAGPGASHLPIGTYDAQADRAPLLAVSGQVPLHQVGSGGFQEIDLLGLLQESTGLGRLVASPGQVALAARACAFAVHRRTPAHLVFPSDVLTAPVEASPNLRLPREWLVARSIPDPRLVSRAAARLSVAGEAAVVVGAVGAEVRDATERVAARLGAPVAVLPEGIHYLRDRTQHVTVRVSGGPDDPVRALVRRARRVLVVGPMSAGCRSLIGPGAAVVNVAPASEAAAPLPGAALRLVGSLPEVLHALALELPASPEGDLGREAARQAEGGEPGGPDAGFWAAIDRALPDDAIVALEPGPILGSALRHLPVRERRITSSFGHGARGYALPAAIAGTLVPGGRAAVAVTSVGGFVETMGELLAAGKYGLPVRVLCLDDGSARFDVAAAARSLTAVASHAPGVEDLAPALARCLGAAGPSLVHTALQARPHPSPIEVTSAQGSLAARIAEMLERGGVTHVYGRMRPSLTTLCRALAERGTVRFVPVQHPESAAMMASAHSKWTSRPAVCVAADGPDLLFQLNGLYDAAFDRNPVVVLTSRPVRGANVAPGGDTVDAARLLADVAVSSASIEVPAEAPEVLAAALAEATRSRAVVHVALDWDLLDRPAGDVPAWFDPVSVPEALLPPDDRLDEAADRLAHSRRPAILVGRGAAEAADEIRQIAELLDAPIAATMPGRGILRAHPHAVGGIGASGHASAIDALARCDVLLALGASNRGAIFGLRGRFFQVQVDREPLQLGRRPCPTLGLHGTTRETLQALLPRLRGRLAGQGRRQAGRARFLRRHRRQFERWQAQADAAHGRSRRRPIAPPAICHALARTLAELGRRAVVTVDVGVNTLWVYRHFLGDHDFVWTSSFATMGFALPAALAIRELEPERTVIAMVGDGGMGLSLGDLASAAARGLPVVAVVFDNGKLAAIKYEQEVMGWPEFGSALCNGSFAAYAQACGVRGLRVTDPAELAPALREALTCGEPCVVDVVCDPHFMPAPPRIHPRQAAGYLLALSRELRLRLRGLFGGRGAGGSKGVPQPHAQPVVRAVLPQVGGARPADQVHPDPQAQ